MRDNELSARERYSSKLNTLSEIMFPDVETKEGQAALGKLVEALTTTIAKDTPETRAALAAAVAAADPHITPDPIGYGAGVLALAKKLLADDVIDD